jgi:predicted ATPase
VCHALLTSGVAGKPGVQLRSATTQVTWVIKNLHRRHDIDSLQAAPASDSIAPAARQGDPMSAQKEERLRLYARVPERFVKA